MIKVTSICKRFGGLLINKNPNNAERAVSIPSLTRMGMELNGVFLHKELNVCVVWGKTENNFLKSLGIEERQNTLKNIFKKNPPIFLLSKLFDSIDLLVEINKECNDSKTAIVSLPYSTADIFSLIGTWLSKSLATWTTVHGTVIDIFGVGTLIIGDPGIGKSEIALELLKMNHLFLCDDATEITRIGNTIVARAHSISHNFIQIRGLGILNVREMYGGMKIIEETNIGVVIELKHVSDYAELQSDFENLGETLKHKNYLEVDIPHYIIPVTKGRNIAEIIEAAIIDLKLKKQGYFSAKKFNELTKKYLTKQVK